MGKCKFSHLCISIECEFCHHNPDACTQEFFEWNGEDEEPTQDELDAEVY